MKPLFIALIACFVSVGAMAQPGKKDSLLSLIRTKNKLDTGRLLAMTELSYSLWNINPDSSYLLASEANKLAKEINNNKIRGRALRLIGIYFRTAGKIAQALVFCDSAIDFAQKAKDKISIAKIKTTLGLIYQEQGNYAKALDLDFDALRFFEQTHAARSQGISCLNIGQVYVQQKLLEKSIIYFEKAIQLFQSVHDLPLLGLTTESLAYVYGLKKDYPKAIELHREAKNILEKTRDKHALSYTHNSLAEIYLQLKQYDKANAYLAEGLTIATREGFDDRIADFKKTYAQYYNQTGQFARALSEAEESQRLSQKVQNVELMRNATEQKFEALKNAKRYAEALETYSLFSALKDSMQNQQNKRLALAKEFSFQEEKLKTQNASLAKEAQLKDETLRRTQIFLLILAIFSVAMTVLSLRYYRSLQRNKKMAKRIQEQSEEIQAQSEELVQANEEILRINENLEAQVQFQTNQILSYAFQNAHNVRGPLARILGLINLVERGLIQQDEMLQTLKMINISANELDEIIKKINRSLEERVSEEQHNYTDNARRTNN
ncbi:MAG: tetratricopeptide repeat protein [Bacteroidetes bacterium]|nr:tetratricopeptide repeat protein [Bacteroidota bacterium]MBS1541100.1 tetratricopeptide repeat protein [Bacteroidota bacterium]